MSADHPIRAAFYFDGCNVHQGLREGQLRKFYWLSLSDFALSFLSENQKLVSVKYFTARVTGDAGKNKRHSTYIEALQSHGGVEVIEGKFQMEPFRCGNCSVRRSIPKEKQTDVNIATAMVVDAFLDLWDTAFLVSGDADLAPPIRAIRTHRPQKTVVVVSPLNRHSGELSKTANGHLYANRANYAQNQLPDEVPKGTVILRRPEHWN